MSKKDIQKEMKKSVKSVKSDKSVEGDNPVGKKSKLISGSILGSLVTLAVPIVLSNVLQSLYQMIDTVWVGRVSTEAVAAVSMSFPVLFLILAIGTGLAIAGTVLVSQHKGREDQANIDLVSAQTMSALTIFAAIFSVIGYFASGWISVILGAEGEVLEMLTVYLEISFLGLIPVFVYFAAQSLLRGVGNVKTPMYIVAFTVLLNAVLDPLFIMGWGSFPAMGVKGAAIATVLTQSIAAVMCVYVLLVGRYGIQLRLQDFKLKLELVKTMVKLGLPASIEQSAVALSLGAMTIIAAGFGPATAAAYGVGVRIFGFVVIPAMGLSMATSTLVGQNIGAKQLERVRAIVKMSGQIGFSVLFVTGVLAFIFAEPIVAFIVPGDPEVIRLGVQFLRVFSAGFGLVGIQRTFSGAFIGSGNTMMSMGTGLVALWIVQFPVAFFTTQFTSMGQMGIWIAFPLSYVASSLIGYWLYTKSNWIEKKLV